MTPAQLATLATNIAAQPSLNAAVAAKDWPTIAAFYNAASNPVVLVWRPNIAAVEIVSACVMTEVIALTPAAKLTALQFLLQPLVIDATSANVRAAFGQIFSPGTTLTALTALASRTATRIEALLAGAPVGGAVISQVYGQALSADDVQKAMGS